MYDYIELRANAGHSEYLPVEKLVEFFSGMPDCEQTSNACFTWKIGDYWLRIQGIRCSPNGSYAYDNDSGFRRINLIEVNLPQGSERHEDAIRVLVQNLADQLEWEVDWRE